MTDTILRVAIAGLLLLGGCKVRPPIQGRADPYPAAQIHFSTEQLRVSTAVGAPIVQRDEAGNLVHVTVPIRSAINKTLYVDYRVTFLDASGAPISQLGWFQKTLEANTPDSVSFNSLSPRAADFRVDFRFTR